MTAAVTLPRRAFAVWWKDLGRWVIPSSLLLREALPPGWKRLHIAEIVRPLDGRVLVEPEKEYKMAGVKWYGEGVFHRETVRGDAQSAKFLTPLVPGALIYNRLFAWKASFAIVPTELADCFVSSEFPQFKPDTNLILPDYLYLFCVRDSTIRAVNAASTGSAAISRNRFKEEEFLNFEISLPPLAEQKQIVARWREAKKQIAAAQARIEIAEVKILQEFLTALGIPTRAAKTLPKVFALNWKNLGRWSISFLARSINSEADLKQSKYEVKNLADVALVTYGIQKCPGNRPGNFARPYLRVANVQKGKLDLREVKTIEVTDKEFEALRLRRGDLLVCEGNSADLVGRPAIWNDEIPDCVHQNHLLRVRVNPNVAIPEFVLEYMHTPAARNHFRARAKFTTNLASINSNDLRELQIPLPPLPVQREIVARVASGRIGIAREREAAERMKNEITADIEAMILGTKNAK